MTKEEWAERIRRTCVQAKTYKECFELVIEQLAQIMEIRDKALQRFHESNDEPLIIYTNKGGHKNMVKNPALSMLNEQNQLALAYWRDLGLTPSGYKKLTGDAVSENRAGAFERTLREVLK